MRAPQICVTGSILHTTLEDRASLATLSRRVGIAIADQKATLVIGGRDDTNHLPTHAYEGAMERGGTALVIVEGENRMTFNRPKTIVQSCGMTGSPWEVLIGQSCDAIIAIGGRAGSLIEMLVAYKARAHIIVLEGTGGAAEMYKGKSMDTRNLSQTITAKTPEDAVRIAIELSSKDLQASLKD